LRYSALACNGNRIIRTPALDRLAREGITFDQAFSGCPVCSPYRGQLLTGRYSHANGVIDNEYRLFDNEVTMAHTLGREGYNTAFVGKWHLGYGAYTREKRYGFDDLYAHNMFNDCYRVKYWHNEEGPFRMMDFAPKVETQLVLDYLERHVRLAGDQPFCVVLGWVPPHWNHCVSERDYGRYPQQYNIYAPEELDVPANVPRELLDFARKELADYYGMITALDACMQRILNALDELGLAENTIVCFSSDHGDHLSSHGFVKPNNAWVPHTMGLSKGSPYEESVHIPFILRYPAKVSGNRRSDVLFNSVDVFPTLMGLCGIDAPESVQGADLSHAVLGQAGEEPDSVYLQMLGPAWPNRAKAVGLWRGIRTPRYMYARWKDCDGKRLLYDKQNDPLEMHNLIGVPEYASVAQEMEERLQRWIRETDDPFDTGKRLPVTDMLDVGQTFVDPRWYGFAPQEYAA